MTTEALFADLVGLQIELWNALDARLRAELGLPLSDCEGLRVIAMRETSRVNDLAETLVITVGGASKLADRLERAGLVARHANPGDRRSSVLRLTEAGISARERAAKLVDGELASRVDARLEQDERRVLAETLHKLRLRTADADPTTTKGTP
ncbi:MAG: winged helix-turn-helix transcriptional regulator [Salinibacterium sp.]|nr:winged helix-turn-helix transcriptional regulator [Salinibacterium sp.]